MSVENDMRFNSFEDFYPFYLQQHSNLTCRVLHYLGSTLVLALLAIGLWTGNYLLFIALPFAGYGCAWIGHFVFEKNRPATFKYPIYSLMGDWVMYKDWLLSPVRGSVHNHNNKQSSKSG